MMIHQKKFEFTHLFVPLTLWVIFCLYTLLIPPDSIVSFLGFYLVLFLALFRSLRLFFHLSLALPVSFFPLFVLGLFQFQLNNSINLSLLGGLLITIFFYFRKGK
ncbi:hypothetical protein HYW55_04925 [Candidatus Gottesmanbacteria bacterium]|nr:hypothetical protein [Candidatus Gottesmanbacteria bacterium]